MFLVDQEGKIVAKTDALLQKGLGPAIETRLK